MLICAAVSTKQYFMNLSAVLESSDMSDIFVLRIGVVFEIIASEPQLSLLSSHLLGLSTMRTGQQVLGIFVFLHWSLLAYWQL